MNATIRAAVAAWVRSATGLDQNHVIWYGQSGPHPSGPFVTMRLSVRRVGQDWVDTADAPLVLTDDAIESIDAVANTATLTAHAYLTGDGPVRLTTSGSLAGTGLAVATDYWLIKSATDTVKFALSLADAIAGTAIDLLGSGTGTHTIVDTADTVRQGSEITYTARGLRDCVLRLQAFAGIDGTSVGSSSPAEMLAAVMAKAKLPVQAAALVAAKIGLVSFGELQMIDGVVGASFDPRAIMDVRFYTTSEVSESGTYIESVEVENLSTGSSEIIEIE